jgi:hypothetical protein
MPAAREARRWAADGVLGMARDALAGATAPD